MTATQKEMFAADQGAARRAELREALDAAEAAARDVAAKEASVVEAEQTLKACRAHLERARAGLAQAQHALTLAAAALATPNGEDEQRPDPPPPATPAPEPRRASAGSTTTGEAVVPLGDEVVTLALPAEVALAVGAEPIAPEETRPAEPAPAAKPKRSRKKKAGAAVAN